MKKQCQSKSNKKKIVFYLRTLRCLPFPLLETLFGDYIGNAVCLVQFADRAWVYGPWPQKQPPTLQGAQSNLRGRGLVGGRVRVTCLLCSSAPLSSLGFGSGTVESSGQSALLQKVAAHGAVAKSRLHPPTCCWAPTKASNGRSSKFGPLIAERMRCTYPFTCPLININRITNNFLIYPRHYHFIFSLTSNVFS